MRQFPLIALCTLCAAGEAPPPADSAEQAGFFQRLDADGNGELSLDELLKAGPGRGPGAAGAAMPPQPEGRQGRRDERRERRERALRAAFPAADADASGGLSRAEFAVLLEQMRDQHFTDLDTDHDGKLSRAELEAGRPPRPGRAPGDDAEAPGASAPSGRGPGRRERPDPLAEGDRDGDGFLSQEEFRALKPPHHQGPRGAARSPKGDG